MKPIGKISIKKLRATYGPHARTLLHEYLDELPRKKKGVRTYKILKALPTVEEFKEMRVKRFTTTADDLVEAAFSEFEELAMELGEWYDNLPEQFQAGDKGCQIEEAKDMLENLERPDVPDSVANIEVFHMPAEGISSRASRRDDAVARLQAVVDEVNDLLGDSDKDDSLDTDDLEALASDLEAVIIEAEGIEFPGMYS